jgi:hypothetical protein
VSVYRPHRIADLGLAITEGLVDANDIPFADDIEGLSGRVHWRLCGKNGGVHWRLCGRFLGGPSSGGGGEVVDRRQCMRPGRQEWVVPPPCRSGNESTETRRATPNHHGITGGQGEVGLGLISKQWLT